MLDRIETLQGRSQIYGTQFSIDPLNNKKSLYPIKMPEKIDSIRASVGLTPLKDYLEFINKR